MKIFESFKDLYNIHEKTIFCKKDLENVIWSAMTPNDKKDLSKIIGIEVGDEISQEVLIRIQQPNFQKDLLKKFPELFENMVEENYYANNNGIIDNDDATVVFKHDVSFGKLLTTTIQGMYIEDIKNNEPTYDFYITATNYDISKNIMGTVSGAILYYKRNISAKELESLIENMYKSLKTKTENFKYTL